MHNILWTKNVGCAASLKKCSRYTRKYMKYVLWMPAYVRHILYVGGLFQKVPLFDIKRFVFIFSVGLCRINGLVF
jgi:hypothetical protein